MQETSLTGDQRRQLTSLLHQAGHRFQFTSNDPEAVRPVGGLGVITTKPLGVYSLVPKTKQFAAISNNGRCQLVAIPLPGGLPLVLVQIYAWTAARQDANAAARSDDMIHIVMHELEHHPQGPKMILRDFYERKTVFLRLPPTTPSSAKSVAC